MLAPCTVTDAEPVPSPRCFDAPCSVPLMSVPTMPSVHARILDPLTVITTRRVPRAPCLHHDTSSDVSDSHSVASHPVCPSRALSRIRHQPHARPMHRHRCRARACPVAPSTRHAQSRPCPIDHALRLTLPHLDPLPSSPPVGCPELRVPPCTSSMSPTPTPSPRILSVSPEPCPVYATSPMLAPCTVTDAEPVPARLPLRRPMLSPAMSDRPCPQTHTPAPRSPAVITTRRVPRAPRPTMHLIDVSDSHSVASHPVCPSRALSRIRHQPHARPMHRHRCRARAQPGCPFDAPCSVPLCTSIDHA